MYEKLTTLLQKSAENDKVLIFALTANGDFFSSGNDLSSLMTMEFKSTIIDDMNLIVK
jgi:enoyl-CoA hydratase/carnithine racemase